MAVQRPLAVAILAAGKGKRMGDPEKAKVLALLHGTPLLGHVLHTTQDLQAERVAVIVGHQRQAVMDYVADVMPRATCQIQEEQLGTGHAVQQTEPVLGDFPGDVLILSGDVPLLSVDTLQKMLAEHQSSEATLTVLTTNVPDPTGYGRIIRSEGGDLVRIVEHKDATPEELAITEINSGVYLVSANDLFTSLSKVKNTNAQAEYYLTDIAAILNEEGKRVRVFNTPDWTEVHGINTPQDLAAASEIFTQRIESSSPSRTREGARG